jgi:hypothetical protein
MYTYNADYLRYYSRDLQETRRKARQQSGQLHRSIVGLQKRRCSGKEPSYRTYPVSLYTLVRKRTDFLPLGDMCLAG